MRELVELRALLDRDRAQLLELLGDVQFLCTRQSYLSAAKVFAQFRMHQEQHLLKEEQLLKKLQSAGRIPLALVEKAHTEHEVLRDRIGRTFDAVSHNDLPAFDRELAALNQAIDRHERGEKEELLPALAAVDGDLGQVSREVHALWDRER